MIMFTKTCLTKLDLEEDLYCILFLKMFIEWNLDTLTSFPDVEFIASYS